MVQKVARAIEAIIVFTNARAGAAMHLFGARTLVANESRLAIGVVITVTLTFSEGESACGVAVIANRH